MLLDFYGELLTDKQRECFDLHYNEDLSLSEIAEQLGISRQGVWDNIRRAESAMQDVERKTGLLHRFEANRKDLERLRGGLERLGAMSEGEAKRLARTLEDEVAELIARG
ncbi:MAG: YlxM family DNA-binding protein [Oscillospiraceae bacterium]|nr:YlxM family DNA-binding protein [Oscillospiraceae bacterium]